MIDYIVRAFNSPYCGMTLLQAFTAVAVIVLFGLFGLLVVVLWRRLFNRNRWRKP